MATKVFNEETIELQDGSEATLRPLVIKRLRRFMTLVDDLPKMENTEDQLDLMIKACAIALGQSRKDLEHNTEKLEEILDIDTINRIFELCGGIKMSDPNVQARVEEFLGQK